MPGKKRSNLCSRTRNATKIKRHRKEKSKKERENMLMTFRVSELQMLLGFAGQNKTGRKNELLSRAIEMVRNKTFQTPQMISKIRELYKSIQSGVSVVQEGLSMAHTSHSGHTMPQQMMAVARQQISNLPGFHPLTARTNMYGVPNPPMYQGYAQAPRGPAPTPQVQQPIQQNINPNPDVTLKRIPFYEIEGVLLRPTALLPNQMREPSASFQFFIPPSHADVICFNRECIPGKPQEFLYQIQMRFCVSETSCEQEDSFPPGIVVKVNGKPCTLPSGPMPINKPPSEIKRPPRPVNISSLCKLCPSVANVIHLTWSPDYTRGGTYVVGVWCVKKLSATDLLEKLKAKGPSPKESTVNMIKEKLQEDEDIATTELRVSLLCPLGKMMIGMPIRPVTCTHLQCFDATIYLQMNEKKPTWSCPVCNKPAIYDNLVIDSYFVEVLSSSSLHADCNEVLLLKDGSWAAHDPTVKKKVAEAVMKVNDSIQEINDLDSEDSMDTGFGSNNGQAKTEDDSSGGAKPDSNGKVTLVDLTETDSEDESSLQKAPPAAPPAPPPPAKEEVPMNGPAHTSSPSIIMLDSPSPPPREPSPVAPTSVVQPTPLQRPPSSEQRSPYAQLLPPATAAHQQIPPAATSPYQPGVLQHPSYHPNVHQPDAQIQSYANYMPPSYDSRYHPY